MDKSKKTKKSKKPAKSAQEIESAVPPHILNMVKNVDKRRKEKNKKQDAMDSIALMRNMMATLRTQTEISEAAEEVRKDKEQDIRMICNARDIFKHLETAENAPQVSAPVEKVKRVEVKPDFLLEGANKAEEIRRERLREMHAMKAAREYQLEEEERNRLNDKHRGDEARRHREAEMDMIRMARQQAIEEQEEMEAENAKRFVRQVSPGLAAARAGNKMDDREAEVDRVERLRMEREAELKEMRRARANMMDQQEDVGFKSEKSEAARELEAFRASRGGGNVTNRYPENDNRNNNSNNNNNNRNQVTRAPKSKVIRGDNWMNKNDEEDKMEELRRAREMELEFMLNARNEAFQEEEEERLMQEAARREEAARKAREMAVLVQQLQAMREQTANDAEEQEKLTRYQEEMMARVMELHNLARGNLAYENFH